MPWNSATLRNGLVSTGGILRTATGNAVAAVINASGTAPVNADANRTAKYMIASDAAWIDSAVREAASKYAILIVGMWRNWNDSGWDLTSVCNDIRIRAVANGNPNIKIVKYGVHMELPSGVNVSKADLQDIVDNGIGPAGNTFWTPNDWWGRDENGVLTWSWQATTPHTNISRYVTRDSNNETYAEAHARRNFEVFYSDDPTYGNNLGDFDGAYMDNFFYKPRSSADWKGIGTNQNSTSFAADYRQGHIDCVDKYRELTAAVGLNNFIVVANVDGNIGGVGYLQEADVQDVIDVGLSEDINRLFQFGFAVEGRCWTQYSNTCEGSITGKAIWNAQIFDEFDYQDMRCNTCAAWLHNGYIDCGGNDAVSGKYRDPRWYDEWDIDLGASVDPVPTGPWSLGVWKREYANALVLMNPAGNGQQTVDVGAGWKSFSGTQDSTTNNGANKSSVTLADQGTDYGDGIILIRQ